MKKFLTLALSLIFGASLFAQAPSVTTTIDNLTPTTITASFEMNESCTKYHILADVVGGMDQWVQMFGTPLRDLVISWSIGFESDTTYTWTDMTPNTDYIVYVVAINATDTSDVLMTTCTTSQGGGEGASVMTVELSNITESSVVLTATPNEQTSRFLDGVVEQSFYNEVGWDSLLTILLENPYWLYETDTWEWLELNSGTEYYAFAIGQNANEEWGELVLVPFTTLGEATEVGESVVSVEISNLTESSVVLTSTPNEHTVKFLDGLVPQSLYDEMGQSYLMQILLANPVWLYETNVWEYTNLATGTEYYAFAIGQNANEEWGEITLVPFTVGGEVGLEDAESNNLTLYPNPATNVVSLQNAEMGSLVEIIDIQGRVIKALEVTSSNQTISLEGMNSGLYVVKTINGKEVFFNKLIVNE